MGGLRDFSLFLLGLSPKTLGRESETTSSFLPASGSGQGDLPLLESRSRVFSLCGTDVYTKGRVLIEKEPVVNYNSFSFYSPVTSGFSDEELKELATPKKSEEQKKESDIEEILGRRIPRRERKIRLASAREMFFRGYLDVEEITDHYKKWRDQDEYLLFLEREEEKTKEETKIEGRYRAVKCAKRGNDVYKYRVKKSLEERMGDVPKTTFFNERDRDLQCKNAKTPLLFFTLTYDTKRCRLVEGWGNIGKEFNRWKSRIKRKYGGVIVLRTWESFESGYPHIHAIVFFKEREFRVFRHRNRFRVQEKHDFDPTWHSYIDVSAVTSFQKAKDYVVKYITKDLFSEKGERTVALSWLFGKRIYSVSRDFFTVARNYRLVSGNMHNSNHNSKQVTLLGEETRKVILFFLGIFTREELQIEGEEWEIDIPPPVVTKLGVDFANLGAEEEAWVSV